MICAILLRTRYPIIMLMLARILDKPFMGISGSAASPSGPPPQKKKSYACRCIVGRVSEPACFGAAPGILYPEPAPVPDKRDHNFGF